MRDYRKQYTNLKDWLYTQTHLAIVLVLFVIARLSYYRNKNTIMWNLLKTKEAKDTQ
jgi:hypothetical protein